MSNNAEQQLRQNDFRLSLVRLVGPALTVLVTLGQLGVGNRFNAKGPGWLDPASLSALVASGFFFALYYGNISYVSAQLNSRMVSRALTPADSVPSDVDARIGWALFEYIAGFIFLLGAVGFFLGFLWT